MSSYTMSTGEAVQAVLEGRECESEDGRRMTISSEGQRVDVDLFGCRLTGFRPKTKTEAMISDPKTRLKAGVESLRTAVNAKDLHVYDIDTSDAKVDMKTIRMLRLTLDQLTALSTLVVQLADIVLEEEDARERRRG